MLDAQDGIRMADQIIQVTASLIDVAAAVLVTLYAVGALRRVFLRDAQGARVLMGDGVLAALSLGVASALLKALGLRTWHQIGMFAFVLTFRSVMKHVFAAERPLVAAITPPRLASQGRKPRAEL